MTKQDKTYSGKMGDLARLTASLAANATDLTHLDGIRVRLEKILADAHEVAKQQASLTASGFSRIESASPGRSGLLQGGVSVSRTESASSGRS